MYELYTTTGCRMCELAERLLNDKLVQYIAHKVDKKDKSKIEWIKETYPDARMFPIVIKDKQYIGSYVELNKAIQEQYT